MELSNSALHHRILSEIVERGFAPNLTELGDWFQRPLEDVISALRRLADDHGVVLHPQSYEIWVAHPFSLAPTSFFVTSAGRLYWGNCAWCSLGVAALLGGTATIRTQLAWSTKQVDVRIESGRLLDRDYLVHFPVPMAKAWDNVTYTCSMMLLFEDSAAVDSWCERFGKERGDVRPIEQIWEFSREWYGQHLATDWRKWTSEEAKEMFVRHGLSGPTWQLDSLNERF